MEWSVCQDASGALTYQIPHSIILWCGTKDCACLVAAGPTLAEFNRNVKPTVLRVTATTTGTDIGSWVLTAKAKQQQQQQQKAAVQVTLYIYTVNPQLVWYRMAQPPLPTPRPSSNSSSCSSQYCRVLILAGVPVDSSSIQMTPSFDGLLQGQMGKSTTLDAIAAELQANREALDNTRKYVGYVAGPVLVILLLLVLWWQRQRLIGWCRGKSGQPKVAASDKDRRDQLYMTDDNNRTAQQQIQVPTTHSHSTANEYISGSGSGSTRDLSSVESSVSAASSSSKTAASSSAAAPPRTPQAWAQTMDYIHRRLPADGSYRAPGYATSAADGTASESGTVVTIRDYISDQAAAQQRWQQQQWAENLNPLERDVIERYFSRMQQQVEMMNKPGGSSNSMPDITNSLAALRQQYR